MPTVSSFLQGFSYYLFSTIYVLRISITSTTGTGEPYLEQTKKSATEKKTQKFCQQDSNYLTQKFSLQIPKVCMYLCTPSMFYKKLANLASQCCLFQNSFF